MAGENIAGGSGPLRVTGAHLLDNSKELRDQSDISAPKRGIGVHADGTLD